jgi:hypothetical protein
LKYDVVRDMKGISFTIFSACLLSCIASCERDDMNGDVVTDVKLFNQLYRDSNDTICFGSDTFILETELYRDFFPGSLRRLHKLVACIYLVNTDSLTIASSIDINKLYVIHEQSIWVSKPTGSHDKYTPVYKLLMISKDGPEWATGSYVDVIIEIRDKITASRYYLLAPEQLLQRIE